MLVPTEPKIYHIVHFDRLASIVSDGHIWCDAKVARDGAPGTTIGMNPIKQRRLEESILSTHPDLYVGDCAPFYFCPRSVMLYKIYKKGEGLEYRGGQGPIVHLEADLRQSVAWADDNDRRWAFTLSNAGSSYFEDYTDLSQLDKLNWDAIRARWWRDERKERKQAEFLMEWSFPWELVSRVGVHSAAIRDTVLCIVQSSAHRPAVVVKPSWYY